MSNAFKTLTNSVGFSVYCGLGITFLLAVLAFGAGSRTMACTFAWQSCLLQAGVIPSNAREGTPLDPILFGFGLLLGIPIYSALTYVFIAAWRRWYARNES